MTRLPNVRGRAARAALAALLLAGSAPLPVLAQTAPSAAAPAQPAPPRGISEAVAAVVNDQIISTYDLAQRMRLLIVTSGVQPTAQTLPQFQREALISLVDERLQMQELRRVEKDQKIQLIARDADLDDEMNEMARGNNMTREQFLNILASQGVSPDTMREQLRVQVSWQRWIRGRYGSRLKIGEDQIKGMQERLAAASTKPRYQFSEVLLDANRVGGMDNALQGANQLIGQLQQGAPFPAVARQFSASPTAAAGGDAGWVSQGELAPELDAALEQMRPGQLSRPIATKDGVYIVYLRDKNAGAGAQVVNLKQAAVALAGDASAAQLEAARAKLESVRAAASGCEDLEAAARKTPGVVAGDLGEAEIKDLAPDFRQAAETLQPGQISQPIRTAAGLHLVAVCAKRAGGATDLSHDEIENRLFGQQLSMISRRYMRDLRNSATIETR